ncbi:MAG: glycosyltransferase [Actinobacteria bacterium]|nr:glycosyltransferase [Actinomycetota bacterium]
MKLVVVTPHFAPDVAPTGEVVTRITHELIAQDHRIEVITSLPWYRDHRIEPGYEGKLVRYEDTPWGRIVRVNPFPTTDKRNIARRAASFVGFSLASAALGGGGEDVDGVLALSPPLTLGLTGWVIARRRKAPLVFNIQDVYPDVAIELGMLSNPGLVAAARRLERICYARADAVTVLSDDLKDNISPRVNDPSKVRVIPNFVDTEWVAPAPFDTAYRKEHGLSKKFVVMYAGNVGLSQSLDLVLDAAAALAHEKEIVFVINGGGAGKAGLERRARGMTNVVFVDMQPIERLPEVLAAADLHLVPLKRGLARSSVPSKTYSILAAGRPLIASVDPGSEVARVVERAGAGLAVPPEDSEAFTKAVRALYERRDELQAMGAGGRAFIERWASPAAVAKRYADLFIELNARR